MLLCFQQAALHLSNRHGEDLFAAFCLLEGIFNSKALYIINRNEIIITAFCISEKHNRGFVSWLDFFLQGNCKIKLTCHMWEEKVVKEEVYSLWWEKYIFHFFPVSYILSQSIIVDRFLTALYMLHELNLFSWELLFVDLMKHSHSHFFSVFLSPLHYRWTDTTECLSSSVF